jgi:hypothetical protein
MTGMTTTRLGGQHCNVFSASLGRKISLQESFNPTSMAYFESEDVMANRIPACVTQFFHTSVKIIGDTNFYELAIGTFSESVDGSAVHFGGQEVPFDLI